MISKAAGASVLAKLGSMLAQFPALVEQENFGINFLSDFSSRGPTADGRIKPDILAPGEVIFSAASDGNPHTNNCPAPGQWSGFPLSLFDSGVTDGGERELFVCVFALERDRDLIRSFSIASSLTRSSCLVSLCVSSYQYPFRLVSSRLWWRCGHVGHLHGHTHRGGLCCARQAVLHRGLPPCRHTRHRSRHHAIRGTPQSSGHLQHAAHWREGSRRQDM